MIESSIREAGDGKKSVSCVENAVKRRYKEKTHMPAESVYDLALQYKKTKLWKQLCDTELFAISLSDGELGYCCVMGELGEHIALAVYVGRDGLDSYRGLHDMHHAHNELAQREILMSQDCIQCSFENKDELAPDEITEAQRYAKARGITFRGQKAFPQFKRFKPARYPWFIKEACDEQVISEALSAAIEISERLKTADKADLGFLNGPPFNRKIPLLEKNSGGYRLSAVKLPPMREKTYPSPLIRDELLIARLKKKGKTGAIWACDAAILPSPVSDEDADDDGIVRLPENAPFFPFVLLIVDSESEMVMQTELITDFDRDAENLVIDLGRIMAENGVPSEIQVRDKRSESLLSGFAGQLGVKITRCDDLPLLDEVEDEMLAHFNGEDGQDEAEDMLELLMEMDDETLRSMPPEMRRQLLELNSQGVLPEPLSSRLRRLFK